MLDFVSLFTKIFRGAPPYPEAEPIKFHCLGCGRPLGSGFFEFCGSCVGKKFFFDEIWCLYQYQDVRSAVLDWKLSRSLYAKRFVEKLTFSGLELRISQRAYEFEKIDVVSFIPIHWRKRFFREFNQAELLARMVSKAIGKPVFDFLKAKRNMELSGLSEAERRKAVKGLFSVKKNPEGLWVLLVDDIATTLSTANEAAKVLKESGARGVTVFCLARAV